MDKEYNMSDEFNGTARLLHEIGNRVKRAGDCIFTAAKLNDDQLLEKYEKSSAMVQSAADDLIAILQDLDGGPVGTFKAIMDYRRDHE